MISTRDDIHGEVYYSATNGRMIDQVRPEDGSGLYSKLSFEALKAQTPDIERVPFEEGWQRYCAGAIKAPWEITEEEYTEMLHLMPPLNWKAGTFMCCELLRGDIAHIFCRIDDRYFRMQDSRFLTPIEIKERCAPLLGRSQDPGSAARRNPV